VIGGIEERTGFDFDLANPFVRRKSRFSLCGEENRLNMTSLDEGYERYGEI